MITKSDIETLIDELADKTLSFGCLCRNNWAPEDKVKPFRFIRKSGKFTVFWSEQFKCEKRLETKMRLDEDKGPYTILGHPIMIGDVLAKMKEKYSLSVCKMLLNFWEPCGLNKSLQQIFDDSGWEEIIERGSAPTRATGYYDHHTERLKDPSAQSLGEYLLTIFKV